MTGTDSLRFLNGQLSNDLRELAEDAIMPALILTTHGKLCAFVFVWKQGGDFFIECDSATSVVERLEKYAIADDVAFEVLDDAGARWHVFGSFAGAGRRARRMGVPGIDVSSRPDATIPEAQADELELLRIERGIPRWGAELTADTLPQEAGLEGEAVSFHKGCYVGQEVVSRIQSVGRVNWKLAGFCGDFDAASAGGLDLLDSSGRRVGWLTSAKWHPTLGKAAALGYSSTRSNETAFSVVDKTGACLGRAERLEFPLVSP